MKINITDIISKRLPFLDFEYSFTPTPDGDNTEIFLPDNIELLAPILISGKITDKNDYMILDLNVKVEYKTSCDRCLDDIERKEVYKMNTVVALENKITEDNNETENILTAEDGSVDITDYIMEELALSLPLYNLCSEDCMGLCSNCGSKLSAGGCDCKPEKEIDPRLAIFKKLLENEEGL